MESHLINSEEQLRELLEAPHELVMAKSTDRLTEPLQQ